MQDGHEQAVRALLAWYADCGVDDVSGSAPTDYYAWANSQTDEPPARRVHRETPPERANPQKVYRADPANAPLPVDEAITAAEKAAQACETFEGLLGAINAFDGCSLKAGAKNTVIYDGTPGADLLVIGEAPGRDEDRLGKPFVGRAGQLLDQMLGAIGRDRTKNVLISNVIFWRPPGNRTPTPTETAICKPFVMRLIELTAPKAVLLVGGAPLQALLGVTGIMRARGTWRQIETPSGQEFATLPTFHPAFLLRQPGNKRLAWSDLQALQARLRQD